MHRPKGVHPTLPRCHTPLLQDARAKAQSKLASGVGPRDVGDDPWGRAPVDAGDWQCPGAQGLGKDGR